jgi:pyruvate-ferredoxin/flavodoxin oxidoreductase
VEICPSKDRHDPNQRAINMAPQAPIREQEKRNFDYFLKLPAFDRGSLKTGTVKGSQFLTPLFEFSGGCTGCGETPYVKLLSQLFGDRAVIANATGCSSIFGGNLPTTPWTVNAGGQGPAWCNSLFEDAAEFGLGFRVSIDQQTGFARQLLTKLRGGVGPELADSILSADQSTETGIAAQRGRIAELRKRLVELGCKDSYDLHNIADSLVRRSVWIVGGDGWAYDIGYGGLDHVLASGKNVNILVLDTEVYSNTGGQASKSTPIGAVARFAMGGKTTAKKDLGMRAVDYGNVYVATVAMGANDNQTVQAFADAESYDGPSIIIAYAHCIAHGIEMSAGLRHQQAAVDSGHWTLYRFDPRRADKGLNPMQLDSREPKHTLREYAETENRFQVLCDKDPQRAAELLKLGQEAADRRYQDYARRATPWPKPEKAGE